MVVNRTLSPPLSRGCVPNGFKDRIYKRFLDGLPNWANDVSNCISPVEKRNVRNAFPMLHREGNRRLGRSFQWRTQQVASRCGAVHAATAPHWSPSGLIQCHCSGRSKPGVFHFDVHILHIPAETRHEVSSLPFNYQRSTRTKSSPNEQRLRGDGKGIRAELRNGGVAEWSHVSLKLELVIESVTWKMQRYKSNCDADVLWSKQQNFD